ncbi:MAG: trimethylamine methyltransferase family protein [Eubacterium sp.]
MKSNTRKSKNKKEKNKMKSYEKFISKKDIEKIHQNTLQILEKVGVIFENEKAHDIFRSHGAKVEGDTVFIPEVLLEKALETVPSQFTLHSNTTSNVTLGGADRIIIPSVSNIYIEDNGRIRKTNNVDTINQFKMAATSTFANSASINQFPNRTNFTNAQKIWANLAMTLKYSSKYHFSANVNTREVPQDEVIDLTKKGIQFLRDFESIEDKEKHVSITGINALSPLAYDHDPIDKIFASCAENQPIWIAPCAMPLLTAPASLAGLMSTTNAEILAGMILSQLIKPGIPFLYGNVSGSTDMRTVQLCIGSPEAALICYATAGLADLYHLPFRSGGALCDAKDLDSQAGAESMMMIYATLDCGADYVMHMLGTMGAYNIVSFEKFILDEEIVKRIGKFYKINMLSKLQIMF